MAALAEVLLRSLLEIGAAVVIGAVIHELAHALTAWALLFRVIQLNLGPVQIRGLSPYLRLVPSADFSMAAIPEDRTIDARDVARREVFMTAAGPLSNLVVGVAVLAGLDGQVPRGPIGAIVAANLFMGVTNLLPLGGQVRMSDGRRILTLLNGGPAAVRLVLAGALVAMEMAGVRPRAWDRALLDALARAPDDIFVRLALYEAAMDRGDVTEAGEHVEALLRLVAEDAGDHPIVYNEAAYYVARHRGDARRARSLLELVGRRSVLPWLRARAEAAVLIAEGRPREAADLAVRAMEQLSRARRSDTALSRDQLEELIAATARAAEPS